FFSQAEDRIRGFHVTGVQTCALPISIDKSVAEPFETTTEDGALGIIDIANSNMLNALKLISVRKGYDPQDFTLLAFGGGGPMHRSEERRAGKGGGPRRD